MGKRKFKKPDDSESEYEWEEVRQTKVVESTNKDSKTNDLEGFLNKYSTKSHSEMRSDKIQNEKNVEAKLYEDRIYKVSENSANKFIDESSRCDIHWLRKSFQRCKEQANSEGIDFMILLKDRYDEKTINFMLQKFGGRNDYNSRHHGKIYSNTKYEKYSDDSKHKNQDESQIEFEGSKISEERYVVDADINEASALLLKAEMSGNSGKIKKLKKRLDTLREAQKRNLKVRLTRFKKDSIAEDTRQSYTVIQKNLKTGKMIPYFESVNKFVSQSRPYDNVNSSLADLLRQENAIDAEENDLAFASMSGKTRKQCKNDDDIVECEYNDRFVDKKPDIDKMKKVDKQKAISSHKFHTTQVSNCKFCFKKLPKHLVLSKGTYFCLIVPHNREIIDFHCQLIPLDHISALTHLVDSDAWDELNRFKQQISAFFSEQLNSDSVFMETVLDLKNFPHTKIDCVPLNRLREMCEISSSVFFRKSMDEAKSEWCSNRKVIDLKDNDIRRTVPKELPYFSVEFDLKNGLALIIENELKFAGNFGLEIVGSLLGKNLIEIKNKEKTFKEQADAVLKFEKKWKSYNLWFNDDDDSSDESD